MARGPIPDRPRHRPTVPEVLPLALAYLAQPGNAVGGHLHIVLDDENLRDTDILWCIKVAAHADDLAGATLGVRLLELTRTQRRKLVASVWAAAKSRRWTQQAGMV